jgi:phosphohistidine phosphatase SixA
MNVARFSRLMPGFIAATICAVSFAGLVTVAHAESFKGEALLKVLQQGGNYIVMRHAASPHNAPDRASANSDNTKLERQLGAAGRASATAMGKAIKELKIPVGVVLTSPTYRALETVKFAQLPTATTRDELGDGGQSMQAASAGQSNWLKDLVTNAPQRGNTVVVTHSPNIMAAFPDYATGLTDGEALVLLPDGKGGVNLLARIKIDEWPQLAKPAQ